MGSNARWMVGDQKNDGAGSDSATVAARTRRRNELALKGIRNEDDGE